MPQWESWPALPSWLGAVRQTTAALPAGTILLAPTDLFYLFALQRTEFGAAKLVEDLAGR